MIEVDADNITLGEWIDNAINTINKLNAIQAEYTSEIKKDGKKYVCKILIQELEEVEDDC